MNKQLVFSHQRRYMAYYLITFASIFAAFGFIIFLQVQQSLFTRVDNELLSTQEKILQIPNYVDEQLSRRFDSDKRKKDMEEKENPDKGMPVTFSMRIEILVRNDEGTIVNEQALGKLFWENKLIQVPFDETKLDTITSIRMEGGSIFHSLTFLHHDAQGTPYYIQLLSSVDGEQAVVDNFARILVVCVTLFALFAIVASYYLSIKSMEPLVKSWRRQTEFVENASHELRTPLTIIQNKLEGLLTTPKATILEKADNIAVSLSETRRLGKLTSNLMTLARVDSDQTLLQKDYFSIDQLLEMLCQPYGEMAEMQEKELLLDLSYGGEICADKERIHELMVLLLDNALKYTHEGDTITVSSRKAEGRVIIRVLDTGIGISEESRRRVFDRFYREDKARSREHGGTGLGLSIAKWIVDAHDGAIKVHHNQPKGTIFEIRLPK